MNALLFVACTSAAAPITGRLLLPAGDHQGAEVHAYHDDQTFQLIEIDGDGRFSYTGAPPARIVVASAGVEVAAFADPAAPGELDLRPLLVTHRLTFETAHPGDVRAGVWAGEIHRGPLGELPSLGSAQFPETALPGTVSWLLPATAEDVTFLVERPASDDRGRGWQTGAQTVLGPYPLQQLPDRLTVQ